ncbi:hypothetical protein [Deinococcus arenicola]|uniref:HK97 gp10 family phage protein n=1 Tax=Deinococcus arenicola TaxID=2994950 RepID=A0ABU4DW34_9DEIO|nr:hypothetical protein [Deinococcus sp. ZS9-10]MDV6376244.1 hypothetical protein [Deinococcus sp. ZS9-10]
MLTVQGDLRTWLAELDRLRSLPVRLNQGWAEDAAEQARKNLGGKGNTAYLRLRSGATRASVTVTANAGGATLSAGGPGLNFQEDGGVIKPKRGKWLTFRIHEPSDGPQATGPWVRVRQVRIPARHPVRDAALYALDHLGDHLDSILGGA